MRSGDLRHLIKFVNLVETRNEYGEITKTEQDFTTTYAHIKPLTGNERFIANQVFADATAQITCRYVAGINLKMIITFGTRKYLILSIQNTDERNIELNIIAKEVLSGGI